MRRTAASVIDERRKMSSQTKERGKPIDPRAVNEDALARHIVQLKEEVKKLSDENQTMKRECNKSKESENWLQREVNRLESELRQAKSDRDNWRKHALEEDAFKNALLQRIQKYVCAFNEEERINRMNVEAFNRKTAAYMELIDFSGGIAETTPIQKELGS